MTATTTQKTKGNQRYSPQEVKRYRRGIGDEPMWVEVAFYEDATVRDQGKLGILQVEGAMLRAYSNDPNFFGNTEYQVGNGIHVGTRRDEKGWIMDCDSDIALKRIMMNVVISRFNFGHGEMEYIGFVNEEEPQVRGNSGYRSHLYLNNPDDFTGFGYNENNFRVERWFMRQHEEAK